MAKATAESGRTSDQAEVSRSGMLAGLWQPFGALFIFVGEVSLLIAECGKRLFSGRFEVKELIGQMSAIGFNSIPIVAMTGFFSGAVLSLYTSQFLTQYGATGFVGATVGLSMLREIGPVLAGIMVAARCGSAMAAQIGTMAVTEQIDALKMLSVQPTNYLVIPRIIAAMLMLPMLALICMWSGAFGGYLVAVSAGVPGGTYLSSIAQYGEPWDMISGLIKTPIFGIIIAVVGCQQGLRTRDGAVGVGRSTTGAVVISMVLVYVANFLLARVLG